MTLPREVVARFAGIPGECIWHPLENAGGFSGAAVWRGDIEGVPTFALKRWPADYSASRLRQTHNWMKLARNLPFVPRLAATPNHWTAVVHAEHAWDLCTWMPGEPCRESPGESKLRAACAAIGELQDVWKPLRAADAICPALLRRLHLFENWKPGGNRIGVWGEAEEIVVRESSAALRQLLPWLTRPVPVQPCLADVHREHVLFTGDAVTGIIDYGAMKFDNVAVDAARYLGDAAEDEGLFDLGCALFAGHHGEANCPRELVRVLDRTGTLGAIANWLIRGDRSPRVVPRLERLIRRWNRNVWFK